MVETTEAIRIRLQFEADQAEAKSKRMERQLASLERRFDPLASATRRYESGLKTLEKGLETGTIDIVRYEKGLENLGREFDAAKAKAAGAGAAVANMNAPVSGLTGLMQRNRSVFQQAGYQVGDFAVQVQGGTSAITAFTQQGSQMLGVFGAYGAIAGAVLAVGAPIVSVFLRSGDAATSYEDALTDLEAAMESVRSAADLASLSADDLSEKFGQGAELLRGQINLLRDLALADAVMQAQIAAAALTEEYQSLFRAVDRGGRDGKNAVAAMRREFDLSKSEAIALKQALLEIGSAEGPEQAGAAARRLNDLLIATYGSAQAIPPAFRDMAEAAANTALTAAEITDVIDDANVSVGEMISSFYASGSAISSAIPSADALLGRIQSLASAAWDYAGALGAAANAEVARGPDGAVNDVRDRLTPGGLSRDSIVSTRRITARGGGGGRSRSGGGGGGGASEADRAAEQALTEARRDALRVIESLLTETEKYQAELAELKTLYDGGHLTLEQYTQAQANLSDQLKETQFGEMRSEIDSFTDALFEGEDAIKDYVKTALLEFAKLQFSQGLQGLLGIGSSSGASGGGWLGKIFGGFFDKGGTINSGQIGIVGEKGPEIVRGPAHVTSRAATARMMGGGGEITLSVVTDGAQIVEVVQNTTGAAIKQNNRATHDGFNQRSSSYLSDRRRRGAQ